MHPRGLWKYRDKEVTPSPEQWQGGQRSSRGKESVMTNSNRTIPRKHRQWGTRSIRHDDNERGKRLQHNLMTGKMPAGAGKWAMCPQYLLQFLPRDLTV